MIAVVGVYQLLAGAPKPEPALEGWKAGFVPLAFPLLINPALGAAVLTAAADHGVATPIVATLVGAAILVALSMTTEHARASCVARVESSPQLLSSLASPSRWTACSRCSGVPSGRSEREAAISAKPRERTLDEPLYQDQFRKQSVKSQSLVLQL